MKMQGKIPMGKKGANVICKNGDKGLILYGQINYEGKYFVYPYRAGQFEPQIRKFKILSYF